MEKHPLQDKCWWEEDKNSKRFYNANGEFHNCHGPAIVHWTGQEEYWVDGIQYSEAEYIEMSWPHKEYDFEFPRTAWRDYCGRLHRIDGPAIEYERGENPDVPGTKHWFIHDKKHREDGPASEFNSGRREWSLDNHRMSQEAFEKRTIIPRLLKLIDQCVDIALAKN